MEPLDPKLARLVHEGMVQAVPDQAREDRVLLGLLARLPPSGPPGGDGGGDGSDAPFGEGLGGPEGGLGGQVARQGLPRAGKGVAGKGAAGKGMAAAGKGTAAAAMGTSTASKVLLVVGLLGAAKVGGTMLGPSREPAAQGTVAATSPAAPPPARPMQPAPITRDPLPAEPPFDASASVEHAPSEAAATGTSAKRSTARARATASPRPSAHDRAPAPAPDVLAAEIQQIAAADRALASGDARRALRLAREHATTHPQGQLALEREAIELGARCLLREADAAEAAVAFLAAHAEAPAAAKVRTRCATSISTDDR